jgi:hypothetical protein
MFRDVVSLCAVESTLDDAKNMNQLPKPAAIGVRTHSGWAALVVLAGPRHSPAVMRRTRIELADPKIPGSKQPYHAAEPLPFKQAENLLKRCTESSRSLAWQAVRNAVDEATQTGYRIIGCGILLASGRPLPDLAAVLASHALIHSAEGELYRSVIADAGRELNLPITGVKEKELLERASATLHMTPVAMQRSLAEMGRSVGSPWRQDEKHAALVAWMALAGAEAT